MDEIEQEQHPSCYVSGDGKENACDADTDLELATLIADLRRVASKDNVLIGRGSRAPHNIRKPRVYSFRTRCTEKLPVFITETAGADINPSEFHQRPRSPAKRCDILERCNQMKTSETHKHKLSYADAAHRRIFVELNTAARSVCGSSKQLKATPHASNPRGYDRAAFPQHQQEWTDAEQGDPREQALRARSRGLQGPAAAGCG